MEKFNINCYDIFSSFSSWQGHHYINLSKFKAYEQDEKFHAAYNLLDSPVWIHPGTVIHCTGSRFTSRREMAFVFKIEGSEVRYCFKEKKLNNRNYLSSVPSNEFIETRLVQIDGAMSDPGFKVNEKNLKKLHWLLGVNGQTALQKLRDVQKGCGICLTLP